jgi:hypothetical protein
MIAMSAIAPRSKCEGLPALRQRTSRPQRHRPKTCTVTTSTCCSLDTLIATASVRLQLVKDRLMALDELDERVILPQLSPT